MRNAQAGGTVERPRIDCLDLTLGQSPVSEIDNDANEPGVITDPNPDGDQISRSSRDRWHRKRKHPREKTNDANTTGDTSTAHQASTGHGSNLPPSRTAAESPSARRRGHRQEATPAANDLYIAPDLVRASAFRSRVNPGVATTHQDCCCESSSAAGATASGVAEVRA